jgi:hypothetical protein
MVGAVSKLYRAPFPVHASASAIAFGEAGVFGDGEIHGTAGMVAGESSRSVAIDERMGNW